MATKHLHMTFMTKPNTHINELMSAIVSVNSGICVFKTETNSTVNQDTRIYRN